MSVPEFKISGPRSPSGSPLLEEIDELPRRRSSYIATNWLVDHALL